MRLLLLLLAIQNRVLCFAELIFCGMAFLCVGRTANAVSDYHIPHQYFGFHFEHSNIAVVMCRKWEYADDGGQQRAARAHGSTVHRYTIVIASFKIKAKIFVLKLLIDFIWGVAGGRGGCVRMGSTEQEIEKHKEPSERQTKLSKTMFDSMFD